MNLCSLDEKIKNILCLHLFHVIVICIAIFHFLETGFPEHSRWPTLDVAMTH